MKVKPTIYYFSTKSENEDARVISEDKVIHHSKYPFLFKYHQIHSPYELNDHINGIGIAYGPVKIIVDYLSLMIDKAKINDYKEVVRHSIAFFPEYDFYFNVTDSTSPEEYLSFLFEESDADIVKNICIDSANMQSSVGVYLHGINFKERAKVKPHHQIILGKDNLFDASNLKWAVIEKIYNEKKQKGRNYEVSRRSRVNNYAHCIHSEKESSLLFGYALYANGYRTSPIYSRFEKNRTDVEGQKPILIIQDSSLFFTDELRCSGGLPKEKSSDIEHLPPQRGVYSQLKENGKACKNLDTEVLNLERNTEGIIGPIDTYDVISSMLERAFDYYEKQSYIYSAVVARTAMEINNGYYSLLWARSLYILSLSENAISVDSLIWEDDDKDAKEQIRRIKNEAYRINAVGVKSKNLVNQIFADCRAFCKSKEHYCAEDAFISEIAHINEGQSIITLVKKIFKK